MINDKIEKYNGSKNYFVNEFSVALNKFPELYKRSKSASPDARKSLKTNP